MRTFCALLFGGCILLLGIAEGQTRPTVIPPKLISMPHPDCRSGTSCHGEHGGVRIVMEVLEDGRVGDVKGEVGDWKLVDAATQAARQAEFTPGSYLGKPKNMNYVMNINF
jgi:hypothetical protein